MSLQKVNKFQKKCVSIAHLKRIKKQVEVMQFTSSLS